MGFTPFERFVITAAREIVDDDIAFVGFHWPMLAARVARLTHAPNLVVVYEDGIVEDDVTPELSTSPSDLRAAVNSPYAGSCYDALYGWLGRGRVSKTLLEAPIVDRRGNVNTTMVGDYDHPKVRLPGSGGGTELAALGRGLVLLCASTEPRSFPLGVDYTTSPGFLEEAGERALYGYPPDRGPRRLVTPLGQFDIEDGVGVTPHALHPGVTLRDMSECFPWLPTATMKDLPVLADPSEDERKALARVLDEARRSHYRLPG